MMGSDLAKYILRLFFPVCIDLHFSAVYLTCHFIIQVLSIL